MNDESDFAEVLAELGDEEQQVLLVLARRLLAGQRQYGRLNLANDPRDWQFERAEEIADAIVYFAMGEVSRHVVAEGKR